MPIGNISTKIHLAIWLRRAPSDSKANSARPKAAHKTAIYRNRAQSGVGRLMTVPNVVTGSEFPQIMKNAAQQGDIENTRTKPASELLSLLARNEQRAPISLLSPAKRTALIQCFDNNGLYKQKGCWHGSSDSKPISGSIVADLRRDGMLTVTTNQQRGSAQLTERGNWLRER